MKNLIVAAAMCLTATSAHAFTEVGKYGDYGFIVTKTLSVETDIEIYNGSIEGIRVGGRGDVTKYNLKIECSAPGNIHIQEDGRYRLLTWKNRASAMKAKPMNGGYFSIYDKFCPPKSRAEHKNTIASGKCAITDNGKLCGEELKSYRESD